MTGKGISNDSREIVRLIERRGLRHSGLEWSALQVACLWVPVHEF